jgi:hypothetical protein
MSECVCTLFIYSGRPDPRWKLRKNIKEELEKIWNTLEPMKGNPPSAPSLGYRGCVVKCNDSTEWFAYKGVVTLKRKSILENYLDRARKVEKLLISSAPNGLIPRSIIDL